MEYFISPKIKVRCNKGFVLEVEILSSMGAWVKVELDQPEVCRLVAAANKFLEDYQAETPHSS